MNSLGFDIRAVKGTIYLEIYQELYFEDWLVEFLRWQIQEMGIDAPMVVRIDSIGGDPRTGLALYNLIKKHEGSTTGYIEYMCDSSVTLPACACDVVVGNSFPFEYMIHEPEMRTGWVREDDLSAAASILSKIKDDMVSVYTEKTGQSEEQIRAWMKETKFMNAQEALELGFIDRIEGVDSTLAAKVDYKLAAAAYDRPKEFQIEGRGMSPANPETPNKPIKAMEEFFKKVKASLGLGDSSDDADVVIKAKELKAEADKVSTLEQQVETLEKEKATLQAKVTELEGEQPTEAEIAAQEEAELEAELTAAVSKFKISASAKPNYAETYKGNVAGLKAALELIPENSAKPGGKLEKQTARASASSNLNKIVAADFGLS